MMPVARLPAVGRLAGGGLRKALPFVLATRIHARATRPRQAQQAQIHQRRPFTIERVVYEPTEDKQVRVPSWPYELGPDARQLTGASVQKGGGCVDLQFAHLSEPLSVLPFWLRDSCGCAHCVTPSSGQKTFRSTDLAERPSIKTLDVDDDGTLRIEWEATTDGNAEPHVSVYGSDELLRQMCRVIPPKVPGMPARRFWDRRRLESELRPVAFADWQGGESEEFWRGLLDLHRLGILIVEGVPDSETGVDQVAQAIGHIHETFYGRTWDVVSKPQAENVAYTNDFLCLHHDLMYMNDPPYIQLLHCLKNECDGGESLFSDGVRAAYEIKLRRPGRDFEALKWRVRYHYERNGQYYFHTRPILDESMGIVEKTSWSPPFQNSFPALMAETKLANRVLRWRHAAKAFSDLCEAPENVFEVKLQPGQCVLFNNRRVLHGRRQFDTSQGHRWLKGTYISEQVFKSRVAGMVREQRYAPALEMVPQSKWSLQSQELRNAELKQVTDMLGGIEGEKEEMMGGEKERKLRDEIGSK